MPTVPRHLLIQPLPQIQNKVLPNGQCPSSQLCKSSSLMLESKFPSASVLKWIVPLGVFRWMVGQYIMRWLPSMNTLSRLTMSVQEIFPMRKIQNHWYLWYHWYLLLFVCNSWIEKSCVYHQHCLHNIYSGEDTSFLLLKFVWRPRKDKYLPAFKRDL